MLSRNFQARVSFVSPALKLPLLQPAPRLVIPKFGRARELPPHPKSLPQPRHAKSPFYPSAGNEAPCRGVKTGGGTPVTYPTFRTSASLSLAPPSPFAPPFVHRGRQNPRNPTLLRRPPDRRPAGDSSPTTSSTAKARRPSSTAPDEDPLSISSSRRISRPVLHLQGAAPTFASSIAPPQSPQRRLDLPHRNRSTLTNSSDEAEANSAPPRRFCTHRCILSFIRSHGAVSARYRADMASPSTATSPATSSTTSLPHVVASSAATSTTALAAAAPALARAAALFLLSVALLHCCCFRSCCCSALALACAAAAARPPAATGVAALALARGATARLALY